MTRENTKFVHKFLIIGVWETEKELLRIHASKKLSVSEEFFSLILNCLMFLRQVHPPFIF